MSLKDLLPEGTYEDITLGIKHDKDDNITRCPQCKKPMVYDVNNKFRPFCSQRCKLIDLGLWAADEIKIKGNNVLEDEDLDSNLMAQFEEKNNG